MRRQFLILPVLERQISMVPGAFVKPDKWLLDRGWTNGGDVWCHANSGRYLPFRAAIYEQMAVDNLALIKAMGL